jgi:preprotein translocase subunit SecA
MDVRNGQMYPSREAALAAGVPEEFIVQVVDAQGSDAFDYLRLRGGHETSGTGPTQVSSSVTLTDPPRRMRRHQKIGRNDPCPCGSGRKYKRCCRIPG